MVKLLTLLKRKPGMTMEEFMHHYETRHRVIGEKVLKPYACRYVRRYLQPVPHVVTGEVEESEHDVVMEIWFEDQARMDAFAAAAAEPAMWQEIVEDEERLFDRPKMRQFILTECESDMQAWVQPG